MRLGLLALATLTLAAAPAAAQNMNAEVYHKRATALMKKGPMALLQRGEINALMTEARQAGIKSKEYRDARVKAGQKPRGCPVQGKASMNSQEFMRRLGAIPQAERQKIDMTEAMTRIVEARYPCPA